MVVVSVAGVELNHELFRVYPKLMVNEYGRDRCRSRYAYILTFPIESHTIGELSVLDVNDMQVTGPWAYRVLS